MSNYMRTYSEKKCNKFLWIIIFTIGLPFTTIANDPDILFQSDEILNLELRANFKDILDDRGDERDYHDASLVYLNSNGEQVEVSLRLRVRGNFRRNPENCKFPPLMMNFKKKEVENTLFENQDKLKLVTPCQFEDDVLEEYLTYKMYNQVTDRSLRVRLAKILYFNTDKNKKVFEKYCFLIEDSERAAERLNADVTGKFYYPFDLDTATTSKMAVFNYMIGNKDYFVTSRHNIIILQPRDSSTLPYPIAYDFDWAEFIDAGYTKPQGVPEEMLENRRVYFSICFPRNIFDEVFDQLRDLRPSFESQINEFEILGKFSKKQCTAYLDEFFKTIDSEESIKSEFLEKCRTKKTYIGTD